MGDKSKIEWTEATWNPVTGCTRVSEGCENCYIERTPPFRIGLPKEHIGPRQFLRLDVSSHEIGATTGVMLHPNRLDQPMRWTRPRMVFVNSLSDLFHDDVPDEFIAKVFAVMALAPQHTYQVTPRGECSLCQGGTSVAKIDWVIVGGESGPNARPMHPDWARSLRDQCQAAGVPFFFKQWGEWGWTYGGIPSGAEARVVDDGQGRHCKMLRVGKKRAGRVLDGREWNEMPARAEAGSCAR